MKNIVLIAALLVGAQTILSADENSADSPFSFVYVTQDGGNGAYEAFPDVCRLADGRLLCVFYDGWGHISLPTPDASRPGGVKSGRITGVYSSDEGKTWSDPVVMIDTPFDDRDPSLCQLADGRLLCDWFTYEPKTEDHDETCKLMLAESTDGGATWSQPRMLFDNVPCSTPIRVLSGGRLILPTYLESSTGSSGSVAYSDDGGKTWSENIVIPNNGMRLDAETDVIELNDGTLYAIQRDKMAYSVSKDQGETWSVSEPLDFPGDSPYFLRAKNGAIVLATRYRQGGATAIRLSGDEAKTWSQPIIVDKFIGAYPSMVELKDGTILIVYYEEGENSNIRARRFQVKDDNQVEWLPL